MDTSCPLKRTPPRVNTSIRRKFPKQPCRTNSRLRLRPTLCSGLPRPTLENWAFSCRLMVGSRLRSRDIVSSMARIVKTAFLNFSAGLIFCSLHPAASAQPAAEARNVALVGHNDLNGNGDGGEGLAIQQFSDGRRVFYLAHEGQKTCLSIVDVTHPENPVLINQLPSPSPGITRCNS